MLQGGVIMDVVTPEQAAVAEEAAVSVMALERVPQTSARRRRSKDLTPNMITGIIDCTSIPVMANPELATKPKLRFFKPWE